MMSMKRIRMMMQSLDTMERLAVIIGVSTETLIERTSHNELGILVTQAVASARSQHDSSDANQKMHASLVKLGAIK